MATQYRVYPSEECGDYYCYDNLEDAIKEYNKWLAIAWGDYNDDFDAKGTYTWREYIDGWFPILHKVEIIDPPIQDEYNVVYLNNF